MLGSDQPPAGAEGPTPADDHPSLCVLTLRADHLPDLQTAEGLAVEFEEFSLKPMPIDRLGLIVRETAKIAGLNVDKGLIAALMRDAKTQDGLPLVAFVLRRLYDRHRADGVLTQAHYEAMRNGKLSPLEVAVRDAATEAMAKAKPTHEQLDALREAFVPALVRVNDEGGFVRQSARLDRLAPQAHELLRELGRARLIVIDSRESRPWSKSPMRRCSGSGRCWRSGSKKNANSWSAEHASKNHARTTPILPRRPRQGMADRHPARGHKLAHRPRSDHRRGSLLHSPSVKEADRRT